MVSIVPVTPRNILLFKTVRLRALQEMPMAFGSTYAREAQLTDADWQQRAERWNGTTSILFLARDNADACGMAGSFLDERDVKYAHLISMWTAPAHRNQGVGRLLVNEVARWAESRKAETLRLMVTSVNDGGILFYERMGFKRTGRTEPYPNDPGVIEYEMSRSVVEARSVDRL